MHLAEIHHESLHRCQPEVTGCNPEVYPSVLAVFLLSWPHWELALENWEGNMAQTSVSDS